MACDAPSDGALVDQLFRYHSPNIVLKCSLAKSNNECYILYPKIAKYHLRYYVLYATFTLEIIHFVLSLHFRIEHNCLSLQNVFDCCHTLTEWTIHPCPNPVAIKMLKINSCMNFIWEKISIRDIVTCLGLRQLHWFSPPSLLHLLAMHEMSRAEKYAEHSAE